MCHRWQLGFWFGLKFKLKPPPSLRRVSYPSVYGTMYLIEITHFSAVEPKLEAVDLPSLDSQFEPKTIRCLGQDIARGISINFISEIKRERNQFNYTRGRTRDALSQASVSNETTITIDRGIKGIMRGRE
jgi:hypothetical protein